LQGDGLGNFQWIPYAQSGLQVRGTVRQAALIKLGDKGKKMIVFGVNDNLPACYELE
jgi:hypothetical protein